MDLFQRKTAFSVADELQKISWSGIPRRFRPITWKLLSVSIDLLMSHVNCSRSEWTVICCFIADIICLKNGYFALIGVYFVLCC